MSNIKMNTEKFKRSDSLNTLCVNLTGLTADGIIIQDKDWQWLARRFQSAKSVMCNQPEWVKNPTEALECCGYTFKDFKKACEGIATPKSCPSYTLAQVFAYIMGVDAEKCPELANATFLEKTSELANATFLDSNDADKKWFNRLYTELAKAIAKAYLSFYSRKESPKQFLLGKVDGYSPFTDVSSYAQYLAYMESKLCENSNAFIE